SCSISADQAGNASYTAAPQVTRTFTVYTPVTFNFVTIVGGANPLAYFRLEALSGASDNNSDAIFSASESGASLVTGAPINVTGNKAISFDGSVGAVTTNVNAGLNTAASIMAWVNLSQLPSVLGHTDYIAGQSEVGNDFDLQFTTDNVLRFYTT